MAEHTKALIESKTFWIAVAQAILGVIAVFQSAYPELQGVGAIAILKSLLDVFLRAGTDVKVSGVLRR